jgi:hypothetical protein
MMRKENTTAKKIKTGGFNKEKHPPLAPPAGFGGYFLQYIPEHLPPRILQFQGC